MRIATMTLVVVMLARCASDSVQSSVEKPGVPSSAENPNREELTEVRQMIAGREQEPAEKVFKNVRILGAMPAGRFVNVMDVAFSRSLGVRCTHCHQDEWHLDTLPAKGIAREMWTMSFRLNQELLKPLPGLKGRNVAVNCTTCHRGELKPALNLEKPVEQAFRFARTVNAPY